MALQGPSGAGKTMSALLLAYGLTNDWCRIAVIDTENSSADLYAHLGAYQVLNLQPPYAPEKYIEAISLCEGSKVEVIIIDSISHCWDFLLDYHASLQGNSFTNWGKITPRMKAFLDKILQSPAHIICTLRVKQDYVINQRSDGKMVPEKVGLKSVMKDGVEYEFTIVLDLDMKNNATSSKDRTGLFMGKPENKISAETGKLIKEWCNSGIGIEDLRALIIAAPNMEALAAVYNNNYDQYKHWYPMLEKDFSLRKQQLLNSTTSNQNTNHQNYLQNGTQNSNTANHYPPN